MSVFSKRRRRRSSLEQIVYDALYFASQQPQHISIDGYIGTTEIYREKIPTLICSFS
jgi:hypothetical protein